MTTRQRRSRHKHARLVAHHRILDNPNLRPRIPHRSTCSCPVCQLAAWPIIMALWVGRLGA